MGDHHHARFGHDRSSGVGFMPGLVMIGPVVWAVGELVVHTDTHTHERYYFIYIDDNNDHNNINPYMASAMPA